METSLIRHPLGTELNYSSERLSPAFGLRPQLLQVRHYRFGDICDFPSIPTRDMFV